MNVKIGTEATQFPEVEYINGIFVAVRGVITACSGTIFSCREQQSGSSLLLLLARQYGALCAFLIIKQFILLLTLVDTVSRSRFSLLFFISFSSLRLSNTSCLPLLLPPLPFQLSPSFFPFPPLPPPPSPRSMC
jgi:hypothetical protein